MDDSSNPLVDGVPAKPRIDHRFAECLELEGAELACDGSTVKLFEWPEGVAEVRKFT
jgi:hypothetical protein